MVFPGRKFFHEFPHSLSLSLGRDLHEKSCERKSAKRPSSINLKPKIDFPSTVNGAKSFLRLGAKFFNSFRFFSSSSRFSATQDHPRDVRWSPAGAEGFAGAARVLGHRKSDAQHHVDPEEQPAAQR